MKPKKAWTIRPLNHVLLDHHECGSLVLQFYPLHLHFAFISISSSSAPFHIISMLCGLCNQISSSAHSGVVQGHIEVLLGSLGQWHDDKRSVRPKSSDKSREVFLEGDLVTRSLWGLSHTGSPKEETRLLGRLCVELAKGKRDTWVGLYTSPMGAFLSERTIVRWTRKVPRLLYVEGLEKGDTIKRSIIRSDCPLKEEMLEI